MDERSDETHDTATAPGGRASLVGMLLLEVGIGVALALLLVLVVLFSSGVSEFIYVDF
jgi:hypothetical protein